MADKYGLSGFGQLKLNGEHPIVGQVAADEGLMMEF